MAGILDWFAWTKTVGLLAYATPLAAWMLLRGRGRVRSGNSQVLAAVAAIDFVLLLDMAFNWRWKLHDLLAGDAAAHHLYAGRRPYQVLVLEVLAVLLVCGIVFAFFRIPRRGVALALAGGLCSVGMWCEEVISYHYIDAIFYHHIGPLYAVCFIWIALSVVTTMGIWGASRT